MSEYKVYAIRNWAKFKKHSTKWIKDYQAHGAFVRIGSNPPPLQLK